MCKLDLMIGIQPTLIPSPACYSLCPEPCPTQEAFFGGQEQPPKKSDDFTKSSPNLGNVQEYLPKQAPNLEAIHPKWTLHIGN